MGFWRVGKETKNNSDEEKKQDQVAAAAAATASPIQPTSSHNEIDSSGSGIDWTGHSSSASLFPNALGELTPDSQREIKCEVMVNWLHTKQEERLWTSGEPGEGVVLKRGKGQYVCCPGDLMEDNSLFFEMVAELNVRVSSVTASAMGLF